MDSISTERHQALQHAFGELKKYVAGEQEGMKAPLFRFLNEEEAFVAEVATPLWRRLALDLNQGRYLSVRAELQALQEEKEAVEAFIRVYKNAARYERTVYRLLQRLAGQHGKEARVGAVMGQDYEAVWGEAWIRGEVGGRELAARRKTWDQDGLEEGSWTLHLPAEALHTLKLPEEEAAYPLPRHTEFPGSATLEETMADVRSRHDEIMGIVSSRRGLLEVLRFRAHLLEGALRLYAWYGYVSEHLSDVPAPLKAPPQDLHAWRLATDRGYALDWIHQQTGELSLSKAFDAYLAEIERFVDAGLLEEETTPAFYDFKALETEFYRRNLKVLR